MHRRLGTKIKKYKIGLIIIALALVFSGLYLLLRHKNIAVLNPKGPVAEKERNLIYFAVGLSLIVVIPVYSLLFIFAYRYRKGNKKAKYSPELAGNKIVEAVWWIIPTILITILAIVAWDSSYSLNPYNHIPSKNKAINIEVVALNWKWLFIYPAQNIASVNYFQFPMNTPVNFQITSDTVMNSFWIPQLGGQIYAMPGMNTQLNLLAYQTGIFNGSSANISGSGFAGMTFQARSSTLKSFNNWVSTVKKSSRTLNLASYNSLAEPSSYNPVSYYSKTDDNLYANIMLKYMEPNQLKSGVESSVGKNSSNQSINNMEMQ